jgi:hypothetical protein
VIRNGKKSERRDSPQITQMPQMKKDGMDDRMSDEKLAAIRCEGCGARLMDSDGKVGRAGIRVQIKCWRCKQIRLVILGYNQRQQDQQESS